MADERPDLARRRLTMATAVNFSVTGANRAHVLGKRLKGLGEKELNAELRKGVNRGARQIPRAVKAGVGEFMPSGYAPVLRAALRFKTKNQAAGLTIQATAKGNPRDRKVTALNNGVLRHPVYANREVWVAQSVKPRFFDQPAEQQRGAVRAELKRVLDDIAKKITS
ncbi:hypothetical protein [Cryptosporangium sp. NPDC051539]|uniref:hypothetical protein n=1 Tax=Cryptosporangium sp. NPDC051539 TaxID=3363962 RepID=UPI0037ADFD92